MVHIYCRKILAGQMELSSVPLRWRDAVEAELSKNGYSL
jgi:hypothetical protein